MTETNEQIVHENTLYAEPLFHIGSFEITNSILNSWVVLILVIILGISVKSKIKTIPTGIQNFLEYIIEAFLGIFDSVTGSRTKSLKFMPFVMSFFFFVLLNNWIGILPGVGSIGQIVSNGHEKLFIPYMRSATADINTTLALATIGVVVSHIVGVVSVGLFRHLNKFINITSIIDIPKKIKKDPTVVFINPIKFFIGLLEIISELAKVASLSFRLFGNVFAGEVLLASMSAILAFGMPIPFIFMEILVGLIQALIFSILVFVYLQMNTSVEEH